MNDFFERHRILRRFAKVATTIVAIFLIYSIYEAIRTYINNQPEIVTKLENIEIQKNNESMEILKIDSVIAFFGLKMELGPIANWGLNLEEKSILVNTKNFQTNEDGIFAIGDICTYPGKLKLILSGFHEGALAARECFARARPNENFVFQYTTSSTQIHKRLGIK